MKITFRITEQDIKAGVVGDDSGCPVSLAVKRELPQATLVSTTRQNVLIRLEEVFWSAPLSRVMYEWIENFDSYLPQQPRRGQLTFTKETE